MKSEFQDAGSNSARWAPVAAVAVAGLLLFGLMGNSHDPSLYGPSVISWLVCQWADPGSNTGHGGLIPLVSAWIVWSKRTAFREARGQMDWRGFLALALCLALFWIGYRTQQTRLGVLGLAGLFWAVPLTFYGEEVSRHFVFPAAYLALAMPLGFVTSFTFPLRLISCKLATVLLQGLAFPVLRQGTAILAVDGSFAPLDVADPCSGLNSVIALTALTAAYGYLVLESNVLRWLMFVLAVPIAVVGNVVRVAAIVVAARFLGQQAAFRVYHDFSGYLVFATAVVLTVGAASQMGRLQRFWRRK